MSYAEVEDIEGEFKDVTFDENQAVSDEDVESFIVQSSATINGIISNRYVVPVAEGVEGFQVLKKLCVQMVADRVARILEVKTPSPELNQFQGKSQTKLAMEELMKIADGTIVLLGATLRGTHDGVSSFPSASDCVQPVFKKGTDQW